MSSLIPKAAPDWQKLPPELLSAISKRATSILDYMSFRGACRSWRSAARFDNFDMAFPHVPWFMYLSTDKDKDEKEETGKGDIRKVSKDEDKKEEKSDDIPKVASFFDMSKHKTCKITNFPPYGGTMCCSSRGWILCIHKNNVVTYLTHPVWRIVIDLPCLDTFPGYEQEDVIKGQFISKMVLSDSPLVKTDLVVMVIWGKSKELGFCRPGDKSWTVMSSWNVSLCDVIYHKGKLCAVDCYRTVVECDIHGPNPTQIHPIFILAQSVGDGHGSANRLYTYYLVEYCGKVLIVSRSFSEGRTISFKVFKLNSTDSRQREILKLGERALFLGSNSSFCLEVSARNRYIKSNCIYFTNHFHDGKDGSGIYCLSSKKVIRNSFGVIVPDSPAPGAWVVPSF